MAAQIRTGAALRRGAVLLVALAAAMLAAAGAARAYVIEGQRWPGTTITYYASAYKKAVDQGAKTWNNAQVGVRFRKVSKKSQAQFVVTYDPYTKPCEGLSLVGYQGRHTQSWMHLGRGCDRQYMIVTATHELGHILGLGHETHRCARMNPSADFPSGTPGHCSYHDRSYWLNHLLKGDDTRGAKALYGG